MKKIETEKKKIWYAKNIIKLADNISEIKVDKHIR